MKSRLLFVLVLCLYFCSIKSAFGFNTIFTIEEETLTTLKIKVSPKLTGFDTIVSSGKKYLIPQFQEATVIENINNQPFSVYTKLLAVPDSNSFHLLKANATELFEYEGSLAREEMFNIPNASTNPTQEKNR